MSTTTEIISVSPSNLQPPNQMTPTPSPLNHSPLTLPWRLSSVGVDRILSTNGRFLIAEVIDPNAKEHAALIVESVNGRPALLSRIEALEGALRRIVEHTDNDPWRMNATKREIARHALETKV